MLSLIVKQKRERNLYLLDAYLRGVHDVVDCLGDDVEADDVHDDAEYNRCRCSLT